MSNILSPKEIGYGVLVEYDGGFNKLDKDIPKKNNELNISTPVSLNAILQRSDIENRNGRMYPKNILEREVNNYQEVVGQGRAVGERDHPDTNIIGIDGISHKITETWWDNNILLGKVNIFVTPGYINYGIVSTAGDTIVHLICNGVTLGVSSRGVGSVENHAGNLIVQDDFELICFDIVMSPSTKGAYMTEEDIDVNNIKMESDQKKDHDKVLSERLNRFLDM